MSHEARKASAVLCVKDASGRPMANALWRLKPRELRKRYNIAYWLWELPEFPTEWRYTFRLFDEIWTPAEFISRVLRECTGLPVYTMPYGLPQPVTDPACDRAFFGLPEDVLENCF